MDELKLAFVYVPVADLAAALAFYRDTLGFAEAWREGERTCALQLPGTDVGLLLIEDTSPGLMPGPVFLVDSVTGYCARNKGTVTFSSEPSRIPMGYQVNVTDPSGNVFGIMDVSREGA
jgi:catechol 2,3-dioxygenase-like lactoylglutathione lyase family enzyme